MRNVEALFSDYASHHQTAGNKAFHRVGIPMITLTLIGMLTHVRLIDLGTVRFDLAMLVIAAATAYYFVLEWRLAAGMLVVLLLFYFLSAAIPFWIHVALFVAGWILQFIGHSVYEKRRPAFLQNFLHFLIGPLWILNDVMRVVKPAPAER